MQHDAELNVICSPRSAHSIDTCILAIATCLARVNFHFCYPSFGLYIEEWGRADTTIANRQ
jgi:hypothetical protein